MAFHKVALGHAAVFAVNAAEYLFSEKNYPRLKKIF